MSADPFYEVYCRDGSGMGPHTAPCWTQAEQRARWYAARSAHRYYINRVTPRISTMNEREIVATVIRDWRGKVVTDIQTTDGLI